MYGMWLISISLAFYFIKIDNIRFLLWSALDAGRWPVQVFSGWLQWILLTILPMGAITTLPAMALCGKLTIGWMALGCFVSLFFLVLSRFSWKQALGHYSSASS